MTSYYEDLLRDYEDLFKKKYFAENPLTLRVETRPATGVKLWHEFRVNKTIQVEGIEGLEHSKPQARYTDKNEVNVEYEWSAHKVVGGITNDDLKLEVSTRPWQLNGIDRHFELKNESKYFPAIDKLATLNSVRWGSPNLGGALRVWLKLAFDYHSTGAKLLQSSLNLQIQNYYNVGLQLDHDLDKVTRLNAQFVYRKFPYDAFIRTETKRNILTFGVQHKDRCTHAAELNYDLNGEYKGISGQPIIARLAGEYALTPAINLRTKFDISKEIVKETSWIQKVNPSLTITGSYQLNITNLFNKPKDTQFAFGLQAHFLL